ncbi:MAG: thiamine-phosphate kinase [Chloroflexota bacterium]
MRFTEISAIMPINMKVSELGEFGLIGLIERVVAGLEKASLAQRRLKVGIGDDCAAWSGDGSIELATTDTLVQDVHFHTGMIGWRELGWKSLAVNISDIAAMGGWPTYALVSLSLPGSAEANDIVDFYRGMVSLGNRFGVAIAGGNITQSPVVVITLAVMGKLGRGLKTPLLRSAAVPGDLIAVTGSLGLSSGGLRMIVTGMGLDISTARLFRRKHNMPIPRVTEGLVLRQTGVMCAIDISDGLVGDLAHVCQKSGVSAVVRLEKLPVHSRLRSVFPADYLDMALYGGEDYELLFTAKPRVMLLVKRKLKCPVTIIGEVVPKHRDMVTVVDASGKPVPYGLGGWEHFKVSAVIPKS